MANFVWRISTLLITTVLLLTDLTEASLSILCPNDTAVAPSSGETSLSVNFTFPTAEDSSSNPVEVTCSHQPGYFFPLTETVVTCMAADGMEMVQCSFTVKVGEGAGCRDRLNECICGKNTCTCKEGFTGVVCDIADGSNCVDSNTPSTSCADGCPGSCGCNPGWQGPSCDVVDDGSECYLEGTPPQCAVCLTGNEPPCICTLGWKGSTCQNDYLPPIFIKCPNDTAGLTMIGEDRANVTWDDPQALDNAGGDSVIMCDSKSGSIFTAGITTVTCTATDVSGNSASNCVFSVTVQDNKKPDITCPGSDIWYVDMASTAATVIWAMLPSANDAIDGQLDVTCRKNSEMVVESGNTFLVGITTVTCFASDNSGNNATCSFNVTVLDNEGPVLVCSNNTYKNVEPGKPDAAVEWSPSPYAVDIVEGLVPDVQCTDGSNTTASGNRFAAGETLVYCSAADSVGNRGNCSFTIIVRDNEAPIMTCPGNISQDIDPTSAFGTVDWLTSPMANDTIDGARDVQCSDTTGKLVNSGDRFLAGVTVVTCTASDRSSNEGTCYFVVTVTDNEAPIMACPNSISQNVHPQSAVATVVWPTIPAANDTVDGPRVVNCTEDSGKLAESGDEFPVGVTTVTCEASDNSGTVARCNFTVTVIDNEAPIVTCPNSTTENVEPGKPDAAVNWYPLPKARDAIQGLVPNVTCMVKDNESVQSGRRFSVGTTEVTCASIDSAGNEGNCSFVVTVIDDEPPVMTCLRNITQNVDKGSAYGTVNWHTSPSANDTVDGQRVVVCRDDSSKPVSSGDTLPAGVTIVTCKATDESNNEAACNITIIVTDNEAPVMTCSGNISQNVDQGLAFAGVDWSEIPTANDTVDGLQSVLCIDDATGKLVNSGDTYPVGVTMVTCNASDSTGNKGRCDFTVTVTDNEGPIVTCPGDTWQNVEPGKADAPVHWPMSLPSAQDVVEGTIANVTCAGIDGERVTSGDRFLAGDTLITCSAADSIGNEGNCTFVVTVKDNEAPIVVCPANITMNVNSNMATGIIDWPTRPSANDTVDGVVDVQCRDDTGRLVKSGDGFPVGVIIVTCIAYDRSSNEGNCSFTITVTACELCQNGGFLQDPQTCNCSCMDPYTGPLCSDCKECVNGSKQNRTTCACECFSLYTGGLCDVCPEGINCSNGGTFSDGSCSCDCVPPWSGPSCSDCVDCMNGGVNQDPDTCLCSCPGFYLPPVCEDCGSAGNCQNGGEFSEVSCNCSCPLPFTGRNCTECQPCQNGGSYQNQFTCACDCPYFHTDPLCSICPVEYICLNGGSRNEASCLCQCAAGWRGRDCSELIPNLPDDEYPISPLWTVAEKKVSFEVAVIAPVDKQCNPDVNKYSAACNALVAQFKRQVEIEYKYVTGFSHVNVDQKNLRSGSVVIPHEVIYNYKEMTPSMRGISANALYEETLGRAVDRGWIGTLQVASTGCKDCIAPKDNTNVCNAIPPSCAPGLVLTERADSRAGTCYYVCQSKCKVDLSYCGEGTCQQEPGSEEISCNCPQSSLLMYNGSQCQRRILLIWLYVGVGVGGFLVLLLIVILSVCLCRRRSERNKLDKNEQEKDEKFVYTTELIGKLNDFQNGGHTRASYNHDYTTQSTMELYSQVSKTPGRKLATDSQVDGSRTPQHDPPVQDKHDYQTRIGDRRDWYFWGSQSLPKKQATEIIPMTSETGTF